MPSRRLPQAFSSLEPFVDRWAVSTMKERLHLRVTSSPEERVAFYKAMTPKAEAAIDYLNGYPLQGPALPDEAETLLRLLLALAEISLTEEVNGQSVEAIHALSNKQILIHHELDGR